MAPKKRARPEHAGSSSEVTSGPSKLPKTLPKSATIAQRIVHALRLLGCVSSAQAIVKAVAQDGYEDAAKVRKAIKHGVSSGALQPSAGSAAKFWVGGEAVPVEAAGPSVQIEVVAEGDGAPVELGDTVAINYELFLAGTDQRVEGGKRFTFQVGAGDVIKGMDAGIVGLRVGGKRKVTVPWALGYGKRGSPPGIPPCADLIFKISMVSVTKI